MITDEPIDRVSHRTSHRSPEFALDGEGADEFYSRFAAAQLLAAEKGA